MDFSQVLAGGAVFGVITSMWGKIKEFLWRLASLLIEQIEIEVGDQNTPYLVLEYLNNNFKRSLFYDKKYTSWNCKNYKLNYHETIVYENIKGEHIMFWKNFIPILVNRKSLSSTNGESKNSDGLSIKSNENYANQSLTLTAIRWTTDLEKLLKNATAEFNKIKYKIDIDKPSKKFFIKHVPDLLAQGTTEKDYSSVRSWLLSSNIRIITHNVNDLLEPSKGKNNDLECLIFPDEIQSVIEEVKLWKDNKDWYKKHHILWRKGLCFYGIPGTGKTALARALAKTLDLPLISFDLAELGNRSFFKAWRELTCYSPCIALIEDIDNVFHLRKNISNRRRSFFSFMKNDRQRDDSIKISSQYPNEESNDDAGELNFDVFLNCLDGVDKSEGILTIITTNDISKVDPALGIPTKSPNGTLDFTSSRPGRIDKVIELTYITNEGKKKMANKMLSPYPKAYKEMLEFIDNNPDYKETPAQFQSKCTNIALKLFYETNTKQQKTTTKIIVPNRELLTNK